MKNPNQAKGNALKKGAGKPAQKGEETSSPALSAPLPQIPKRRAAFAILAERPLSFRESFELPLDWIGNSMEPEVYAGNLARVSVRPDLDPAMCELVLGLLKSGELVFGVFNAPEAGFIRRSNSANRFYQSRLPIGPLP